jgi:hypothetical protein
MLVMVTMMGRPPESSLLRGGSAQERQAKLKEPARFVASMRKVAMKSARDAEFAGKKHESAERGGLPVDPGPKHGETRQMKHNEKDPGKRNVEVSVHKSLDYEANRPWHNLKA